MITTKPANPRVLLLEKRPSSLLDLVHQEHHAIVPGWRGLNHFEIERGKPESGNRREEGQIRYCVQRLLLMRLKGAESTPLGERREPDSRRRAAPKPELRYCLTPRPARIGRHSHA